MTLHGRPRLFTAACIGLAVGLLMPGHVPWISRSLIGWNVAVWLYLILVGWMMLRADQDRLHRTAVAQAEAGGAATVLAVVVVASIFSFVGIVVELSAARQPGLPHALSHVLFALSTVVASWLLLPAMFALTYASLYYRAGNGGGLKFPETEAHFHPDYADFVYFAVTIGVASQTADVSVSTRPMRRLVLLQSLLSFLFNTAILALTINIVAGLF